MSEYYNQACEGLQADPSAFVLKLASDKLVK